MPRSFSTVVALSFVLAGLVIGSPAFAAGCPGNPAAIGTSRTIVVDPRDHIRIGSMNYAETLPLADKEVVLTFDDGPLPPHSDRVLQILASQCVKATYFIVGIMARAYPDAVRRVYEAGHTVGTHSMSHPIPFRSQGLERSQSQIDGGIAATAAALGGEDRLAPFFRFPGFGRTPPVEAYVASRGLMVWGADVPADDWHKISGHEIAARALRRLQAKGKGILLLHDIHARTVEALPIILAELKAHGFRIVHAVPSSAERPATVTAADAWRWRARSRPVPPPHAFAMADVQALAETARPQKTTQELCSVPRERTIAAFARNRLAAAHSKPARATKMAMPDVHAVR